MTTLQTYATSELKLVYRVLHRNLMTHIDLLDSDLFSDLQTILQEQARQDGVDVTDHGQWDEWLGEEPAPCAVRLDGRQLLN